MFSNENNSACKRPNIIASIESRLGTVLTESLRCVCLVASCSLRQMVDLIQECLHETEDSTLYVPAAIAKMAYAPGDAIRKKVRGHVRLTPGRLGSPQRLR